MNPNAFSLALRYFADLGLTSNSESARKKQVSNSMKKFVWPSE